VTTDGASGPATVAALAVDGGASKTDVLALAADGSVLAWARGAGSNHQFSGLEEAMEVIGATVAVVRRSAGIGDATVATGLFCLAGVDLPVDEQRVGDAVAGRGWSTDAVVRNDTFAVWRAGSTRAWGVGVVCGSGLNCVGVGPDGTTVRFPSLAELSGDFAAGGSWLGVRTLGLALRANDGRGRPTVLTDLVPAHFGLGSPEVVLESVYEGTLPYHRLFELAQVCLDAAAAGDAEARRAVAYLADEVVAMAGAAVDRLGVGDRDVEVVVGGGVFETSHPEFADRVEAGLRRHAPDLVLRRLESPPVVGAGLLALDALGSGPAAWDRLRADVAGRGPVSVGSTEEPPT